MGVYVCVCVCVLIFIYFINSYFYVLIKHLTARRVIYLMYMNKMVLTLNKQQGLICRKTQPTNQSTSLIDSMSLPFSEALKTFDRKKNISEYSN